LDRATPGSPQFTRAREVLGRQIEHLTRLIDDLLDITRISRGKLELRRVVVDARDIVQKTCADHVTLFEQRGIDFHMEIPGGSLWIDADSTRISQALRNLLVNAAKFTPEGGQVLVGVSRAGNQVEVSVKDNGLGMELETLANLFQPFVQAERARERARGGLGLGLALAKGLVETHGGNLRGESAGTHRGSRFTMSLPLAPAPERKQELPAVSAPLHVLDVLVIEDNVDGAETLAAVLELHGHRAHIATDGLLGLTKARELKPDVILCDLDLPGLDGYEIARRLRAEGEMLATRLIALSGYAGATDKQLALEAGFTAHLAKPVSLDELSALLANKA
ncbi:MAG TPA: ATP-binding protein, partial [Anaeromyxobacteraceae bacterium]|nr:ATP-binding protein [Anaeromyxobacteraceae bacterium]